MKTGLKVTTPRRRVLHTVAPAAGRLPPPLVLLTSRAAEHDAVDGRRASLSRRPPFHDFRPLALLFLVSLLDCYEALAFPRLLDQGVHPREGFWAAHPRLSAPQRGAECRCCGIGLLLRLLSLVLFPSSAFVPSLIRKVFVLVLFVAMLVFFVIVGTSGVVVAMFFTSVLLLLLRALKLDQRWPVGAHAGQVGGEAVPPPGGGTTTLARNEIIITQPGSLF